MGPWGIVFMQLFFIFVIVRISVQFQVRPTKYKSVIVLGSGGHTSEMFRSLSTVENIDARIFPRHYIIAETDRGEKGSEAKVIEFEKKVLSQAKWTSSRTQQSYFIHRIPRSREVGQSYFTSIFTTLWSIIKSFKLMYNIGPDLVLANGPGTCVPICLSAYFLRLIGYIPHCWLVLSESYACVKHASLTTKLLHPIVDILFVQWHYLMKRYPKAIYSGRIIPNKPLKLKLGSPVENKSYVLITVGTTLFEELIQRVDAVIFGDLLKDLGYTGVHIQYGKGTRPKNIQNTKNFTVEVFDYKPDLTHEIQNASLVIGHAGVGTIFDVLEKQKNLIVVPNTKLMNNHQREISSEMARRNFLIESSCDTLFQDLRKANFNQLYVFPPEESNAFISTMELKLRF